MIIMMLDKSMSGRSTTTSRKSNHSIVHPIVKIIALNVWPNGNYSVVSCLLMSRSGYQRVDSSGRMCTGNK